MTKGSRIRRLREQKGLTQEELAKLLKIKRQSISKYEKEIVTNIPSDKLEEMARILDTTPEYILGWEYAVEDDPIKEANRLADIFLDEELKLVIDDYKKLDSSRQAQVRDYIRFLLSQM